MKQETRLLAIIADSAIEEARKICNYFALGDLSFKQADESLVSLRNTLRNVGYDLDHNNIVDEGEYIKTALDEVREIRDRIYSVRLKMEAYDKTLRRELREKLERDQRT